MAFQSDLTYFDRISLRSKVNMLVQKKQIEPPTVAFTATESGSWRCTVTMKIDGNTHVRCFLAPTKAAAQEGALSKFDLPEIREATKKVPVGTWKIEATEEKLCIEYMTKDANAYTAYHATEVRQTSNIFAVMQNLANFKRPADSATSSE